MALLCGLVVLLVVARLSSQVFAEKLPAGGCVEAGVLVAEGSLVPQEDPCHVCHCHRGRIQCFWKSCAPPPRLCEVMQLEDRCNPSLYVCPIPAGIADAPIHSAPSLLTETRQPAPEIPRSTVTAPARGRGRSRSRVRSSRVRSSRLKSSRLRSTNSATVPGVATKPIHRIPNRRRRPAVKPAISGQTVTQTKVRPPQTVIRTEFGSPKPFVSRSQVRSPRPSRRRIQPRPGMKIRLGPPVLPLVQPADNFQPPPLDTAAFSDTAAADSVLSGSTYFNEELSVPQNFTMPQGRGEASPRSPQQLLSATQERKPFRFGPSKPKPSTEQVTAVAKASESQPVTAPPHTARPTEAPPQAPATAATTREPAARGGSSRRTSRRRGPSRRPTSDRSSSRLRASARRVVTAPRTTSRPRPAAPREQVTLRTTAQPAATAAAAAAEAPAAIEAPATTAAPSSGRQSRQCHSRARGKSVQETVPAMTFDYDLEEEDINPTDFMFPEFGRRLRRSLQEDVFDAEAVKRLEEEWSARQRRRRRSLLPGDENHVHGHGHGAGAVKSCSILGVQYELGEVIGVASDNCLECRCAAQAMFCSPKCCFFALEERLLRQARGGEEQPPRPHPLQAYITL